MHCWDAWTAYPLFAGAPGLAVLIIGAVYYFNAGLTLYWIRSQRGKALRGDELAAKYVIFPIYVPFMLASACSDVAVASLLVFSTVNFLGRNTWPESILLSLTFSFQHFAIEGVAFLLMQYGCGYQGARRAGSLATTWVVITFGLYIVILRYSYHFQVAIELLIEAVLFLFYLTLWLAPGKLVFRRKAIIPYAKFWCGFRFLSLSADVVVLAVGGCFRHLYIFPLIVVVAVKPYMIYLTLLRDSVWWQGVSSADEESAAHAGRTDGSHSGHLRAPLMGLEVSYVDAQELAQEVDNLTTEGSVRLLNFAYLSLDSHTLLGSGSYSKVYRGAFKDTPVAIKMLFTNDLNPEVIRRCSSEAQILSKISHPNVVDIFGVAVLPPSVCIVLEICQYGSLSDVIRGGVAGAGGTVSRQVLPLSTTDRMFLALGCARGLRALHRFSPDLCHRDIKSSNFLVDGQLNAKICDLELGGVKNHGLDIHKDGILCTWQAPEVMRSQPATQASDIYSLGLVLWELVSGKVPFAEYGRDSDQLMYQVLRGARPDITPSMLTDVSPAYTDLITTCWDEDTAERPTALEICEELHSKCWVHMVHSKIKETTKVVDLDVLSEAYEKEKSNRAVSVAFAARPSQFGQRPNLPASVARAIATLRAEPAWDALESLGPVLIVGAKKPFLVIGATKKWSQLTGFLMSDVVAKDLSFLEGAQSNKVLLRHVCAEVCKGRSAHACLTHYRRDGSAFVNSVHGFPVFDGNECIGLDVDDAELSGSEHATYVSDGSLVGTQEECERDHASRRANQPRQPRPKQIGDSFSSSVSIGVHLESISGETVSPLSGKGAQHKSTTSLGDKSVESSGSAVGGKSPLVGYGSFDKDMHGKTAFIVLQFSVIVDSRSLSMS